MSAREYLSFELFEDEVILPGDYSLKLNKKTKGAFVMNFDIVDNQRNLLILDRDDTIISDSGYMSGFDLYTVNMALVRQLTLAKKRNLLISIATNQSGINRGFFSLDDCLEFNLRMRQHLKDEFDIEIGLIAICPHLPEENCTCRKPKTRLLEICMEMARVTKQSTVFVGNAQTDFQCGANAGVTTYDVNNHEHMDSLNSWIKKSNDNY